MKKIFLLLSLMLLISGCGGSVKSTEVKQEYDFKVVYATGHQVNFAQFIEYIEDGETVDQFAKRIYQVNKNIMSYTFIKVKFLSINF